MNYKLSNSPTQNGPFSRTAFTALAAVALLVLAACSTIATNNQDALSASGVVEAVEVKVSSEMGGRVIDVPVAEGETVSAGETLLRLDGSTLEAQERSARAGLEAANASLQVAESGLPAADANIAMAEAALQSANAQRDLAEIQLHQVTNAALAAEQPARTQAWETDLPNEFDLPAWYYAKEEDRRAAETELDSARQALETEHMNFRQALENASNADLDAAETRLADAQAAFLVAESVLERAKAANDNDALESYAQDLFNSAKDELEAAQSSYDQMLSATDQTDILEARARLMVAQERFDTARDRLNAFLTGSDSLDVLAAQAGLHLAETGVAQAEAGVEQAHAARDQLQSQVESARAQVAQIEAQLELIAVQMDKLEVKSATDGVVLTRSVQPGEVVQPGMTALVLGEVNSLTITVYLPEDRYGQVSVGDEASVQVDSYPGETFSAVVTRIADKAEFTPRNVQTQEERKTTVYAVELSVTDSSGKLKPGMPADVTFK